MNEDYAGETGASVLSRAYATLRPFMIWCVRAIVALIALSFSVVVGVWAQIAIKSDWPMIYAAAGVTVFAAVFMVAAHEAWHRRAVGWALTMLAVALFLSVISTGIQIGGVSTVKDAVRHSREEADSAAQLEANRRKDTTGRIADLEALTFSDGARIGAATPGMIEPEVDRLKGHFIYKRTKGCAAKEVELADSVAHCGALALAEQKLAAARELAALRQKRDGWVTTVSTAPVSADPQIENFAQIAHDLGATISMQSLRAWFHFALVLALEAIAIFGPLAAFAWGRRNPPAELPRGLRPEGLPETLPETFKPSVANPPALLAAQTLLEGLNPPEPLEIKEPETLTANPPNPPEVSGTLRPNPPARALPETLPDTFRNPPAKPSGQTLRPGEEDLRRWAAGTLTPKDGHNLQAKPLYEVYVVWCGREGIEPLTLALFGKWLPDAGYLKEKDRKTGLMVYTGIALRQVALKVVR